MQVSQKNKVMTTLELLVKNFQGKELTKEEIQQVNEAIEIDYTNIAIEQLEEEGYALGENIWNISDLPEECEDMDNKTKLVFLNQILSDDYIVQEINDAIGMAL